jgi:hypothetical protein
MRKRIATVLLVLLFAGLFLAPARADELNCPADPKLLARFKIEKNTQNILLPVKFQGQEYLFGIDTGASHTLFDISLKDKLGMPKRTVKGRAWGKEIKFELFDAPEAFLGPLNLKHCRTVTLIDLEPINSALGVKRHGIIGMNFLKKYVLQIDFDKALVSFLKPKRDSGIFSFLWPKKDRYPDWGEKVSMEYDFLSGIPHIKAKLDGTKVDFMIDTGYRAYIDRPDLPVSDTFGELETKIFRKVASKIQFEHKQKMRITPQGKAPSDFTKSTVIGRFSIGPLQYKDVTFDESDKSVLGIPFLSRHLVTFDFQNRKMYLKKGSYFDKPTLGYVSLKKLGLVLRRKRDDIFVSSVDPNGPAHNKGIRQNDIILKVNDQDVTSYSLTELATFLLSLLPDIESVTITIKRDNGVRQVSFALKKKK